VHQRPAHGEVAERRGARARHDGQDEALRLQEPHVALQRHVQRDRRDEPPRVGAGLRRDGGVLAEEHEDPAGVRPDEREGDAGQPDHQHRALLVHAQEVVLPRAERLAAQRVQRKRHAGLRRATEEMRIIGEANSKSVSQNNNGWRACVRTMMFKPVALVTEMAREAPAR